MYSARLRPLLRRADQSGSLGVEPSVSTDAAASYTVDDEPVDMSNKRDCFGGDPFAHLQGASAGIEPATFIHSKAICAGLRVILVE